MKIIKANLVLLIILLVGSILRLYNITVVSLWHDEAFSALLIRYPFGEMIDRIIMDVHPPLYYILLRVWDIILGDNLLSLRLFSAFFGVLTIYFTYLFVKIAFKNDRLALISAAFIAINSFQIQYAIEARMYTLGAFLIIFSSWLLAKAIENQENYQIEAIKNACEPSHKKCDWLNGLNREKLTPECILLNLSSGIKKYRWWILYGASAALAIYTHYYLIFSIAAQALFIVFLALKNYGLKMTEWAKNENIKGAIIAYIISLALFLPWLSVFLQQLGQVEKSYWIPAMDRYSISNTILHLFTGTNIYADNANLIIFSLIFLVIFALAMKREKNNYKWLIAFLFLVPFTIAILLSFKQSLYLDRYFVFVGLFYFVILALFMKSIANKTLQNILFVILALGSILLFARGWQNISPNGKPGMTGASKYLFENAAPGDKVYINSSFVFFAYKYYAYKNFFNTGYPSNFNPGEIAEQTNIFADFPDQRIYPEYLAPLLYTPGNSYSQMPHFSGTALLTENDTLTDFNANLRFGENIWLVWTTGFGSNKPNDIPQNWKQLSEEKFQDVFGYRGIIGVTEYRVQ